MSVYEGHKLSSSETVDHIDGNFSNNDNSRVTCGSKSCSGYCAHVLGHNKGNNFIRKTNEYTSLRSLIQEIVSVDGANSGKLLVGNPEQG